MPIPLPSTATMACSVWRASETAIGPPAWVYLAAVRQVRDDLFQSRGTSLDHGRLGREGDRQQVVRESWAVDIGCSGHLSLLPIHIERYTFVNSEDLNQYNDKRSPGPKFCLVHARTQLAIVVFGPSQEDRGADFLASG
jgi:hypothetical protein